MRRLTCALALALGGCVVHGHGHVHPAVTIEAGHVHSDTCGHYHRRGNWYHHAGHVHRAGCGHMLSSGMWISVD